MIGNAKILWGSNMKELNDLKRYFKTQFDQLEHICQSPSPWIFICLSVFIDFLSKLSELSGNDKDKYINLIATRYPPKYRNFKYFIGSQDLPQQIYIILRSGLVHAFSLTPNRVGVGRQRSVRLFHRQDTSLRNIVHFPDKSHEVDAAVLVAEDFLKDTQTVASRIVWRARRDTILKQHIINFLKANPPIAGLDQNYFWQK